MKITYNNVNPNRLLDELIKAGIIPILVENDLEMNQYIAKNTWITYTDNTDMNKVNDVVLKHNSTLLPPSLITEDYIIDLDYRVSKIELGL